MWNPDYFPASYLRPVPTVSSKDEDASTATFPRSTINRTLEDFRILLLAPVLQKRKKVSPEVYRALSLNSPSRADSASDRATAPKRVYTFLQLCATFIPCDHSAYDQAVFSLDAEVDADVEKAKAVLALVEDQHLSIINRLQEEAVSVLLQVLYFLHQGPGVFPTKAPGLGKNRPPRVIQDVHAPAPKPEQADDDSSKGHDVHVCGAFYKRVQRLGKEGRPVMSHAGHVFGLIPEQTEVDMNKEDDAESTDTKDSQ
jgi:hypothetical protein